MKPQKLSLTLRGKVHRATLRAVELEERRAVIVARKRRERFMSDEWKRLNHLAAKVSHQVEMAWRNEATIRDRSTDDKPLTPPPRDAQESNKTR